MDGIVYAAAAALGLATLENVLYVFSAYLTSPHLRSARLSWRAIFRSRACALCRVWGYALGQPGSRCRAPLLIRRGSFWDGAARHIQSPAHLRRNVAYASAFIPVPPGLWTLANRNIRQALRKGYR